MKAKYTLRFDKDRINIQGQDSAALFYFFIKRSPEELAVIKSEKIINLAELKWQKKKLSSKLITPMAVRIKPNKKMFFNDILSFYERLKQ